MSSSNILPFAKPFVPDGPQPLMRPIPDPPEFPVDALGGIMAAAARALYAHVQAPIAVCGQSLLAAMNLAAQGHVNIKLPYTGQERPITLFLVSILESGGRKSTCDGYALHSVRGKEKDLKAKYGLTKSQYQNELAIYESERMQILKGGGKREQKPNEKCMALQAILKPQEPLMHFLTIDECTPQALYRTQETGQPSMGVFTAEGGLFIGGHGMSADYKMEMATTLSKLWDGDIARKLRAGDGVQELQDRRFSMHLMLQPGVSNLFLDDPTLEAQGLLSRVLVTAPKSLVGQRFINETEPREDFDFHPAMATFHGAVRRLLEKTPAVHEGSLNRLNPRAITFSREAGEMLVIYYNSVEKDQGPGREMESIRSLANKLPEHAARIACTVAMAENPDVTELSEMHIKAGITLADYYAAEALRLKGIAEADASLIRAEKVLTWLKNNFPNGETILLKDIYQRGPSTARSAKEARSITRVLEEHRWLTPVPDQKDVWELAKEGVR